LLKDSKRPKSELVWNVVGILAAIALLIYLADSYFGLSARSFIPVSGGEAPPEISLPAAVLVTPLPTTPVPTIADTTAVPAPTEIGASPTQVITPAPSLTADPFPPVITDYGPQAQFTLHRLNEGESYTYLAGLYDTTVEVLESLNFQKEGKRLWVGQYVVVIPGLAEPRSDLPQFIVLQIEETTDLNEIALEYGLPLEELQRYNQLPSDSESISIRLLLVPIFGE
jgi:hypothetical protein